MDNKKETKTTPAAESVELNKVVDPDTGASSTGKDPIDEGIKVQDESAASRNNSESITSEQNSNSIDQSNKINTQVTHTVKPRKKVAPVIGIDKLQNIANGRAKAIPDIQGAEDYDDLDPMRRKEIIAQDEFNQVQATVKVETTKSIDKGINFVVGKVVDGGIYSKANQTFRKLITKFTENYDISSPLNRSSGIVTRQQPLSLVTGGDIIYGIHDKSKGYTDGAIAYNAPNSIGGLRKDVFNIVKRGAYLVTGMNLPVRNQPLANYYMKKINYGSAPASIDGVNPIDLEFATHTPGVAAIFANDDISGVGLFDVLDLTAYVDEITSATHEVVSAATCVESRMKFGEMEALLSELSDSINSLRREAIGDQSAFKYQEFNPIQGRSSITTYRGADYFSCKNTKELWLSHVLDVESSEIVSIMPLIANYDVKNSYKMWHAMQGQSADKPFWSGIFNADLDLEYRNDFTLMQACSTYGSPLKWNTPGKMLYVIREFWNAFDKLMNIYSTDSAINRSLKEMLVLKAPVQELLNSLQIGRLDESDDIANDTIVQLPDQISLILPYDPNDFIGVERTTAGYFKKFYPQCYLRNMISADSVGISASYNTLYHIPTWLHAIIEAINDEAFMADKMRTDKVRGVQNRLDDLYTLTVGNDSCDIPRTISLIADRVGFSWGWNFIGECFRRKWERVTSETMLDSSVQIRFRALLSELKLTHILENRRVPLSSFVDKFINDEKYRYPANFSFHISQMRKVDDQRRFQLAMSNNGKLLFDQVEKSSGLKCQSRRFEHYIDSILDLQMQDQCGYKVSEVNHGDSLTSKTFFSHRGSSYLPNGSVISKAGTSSDDLISWFNTGSGSNRSGSQMVAPFYILSDLDTFQRKVPQPAVDAEIDKISYEFIPTKQLYYLDGHSIVKNYDWMTLFKDIPGQNALTDITLTENGTNGDFVKATKLYRQYMLGTNDYTTIASPVKHNIGSFIAQSKLECYRSSSIPNNMKGAVADGLYTSSTDSDGSDFKYRTYQVVMSEDNSSLTTDIQWTAPRTLAMRRMLVPTLYGYKRSIPSALVMNVFCDQSEKVEQTKRPAFSANLPYITVSDWRDGEVSPRDFWDFEQDDKDKKLTASFITPYPQIGYMFLGSKVFEYSDLTNYKDSVNDPKYHNQQYLGFYYDFIMPFNNSGELQNNTKLRRSWYHFNQLHNLPYSALTWGHTLASHRAFQQQSQNVFRQNGFSGVTFADLALRLRYWERYNDEFIVSFVNPLFHTEMEVSTTKYVNTYSVLEDILNPRWSLFKQFDDERIIYLTKPLYFLEASSFWKGIGVMNDPISSTYYLKDSNE